MLIIENVINAIGNILCLLLEILLVVAIGNILIQAVSNFDGKKLITKIKKLTTRMNDNREE